MKKLFIIFLVFASTSALAVQTIPTDKTVCSLQMIGMVLDKQVGYSCDGENAVALEKIPDTGSAISELSGQLSKFVKAGYSIVNCQYVVGVGMLPQYICNLLKQ